MEYMTYIYIYLFILYYNIHIYIYTYICIMYGKIIGIYENIMGILAIYFYRDCSKFYRETIVNSGNIPVVPHKAVAEVSKIGNL